MDLGRQISICVGITLSFGLLLLALPHIMKSAGLAGGVRHLKEYIIEDGTIHSVEGEACLHGS